MNILVTAGNTLVPIDRVRVLTNIFTGRTGASIALHAWERGHTVTLLTSQPGTVDELGEAAPIERWFLCRYRTFEDLRQQMAERIPGNLDAIIHTAAVSDYLAAGVYAPAPGTHFNVDERRWQAEGAPALVDRAAGKVKSDEPELWLRLVRAPKLIDQVRQPWGFRGLLVKFKLEVGLDDEQLLAVAEQSRTHSDADLMVANTLERAGVYAFLGPLGRTYQCIERHELALRLLDALEDLQRERSHG
jgi:phosphopantothenoylcysteine synthetase/decarboxylase